MVASSIIILLLIFYCAEYFGTIRYFGDTRKILENLWLV